MFKQFKTAAALFASVFSTHPNIDDEQKTGLETALNADISTIKAEAVKAVQDELDNTKAALQAKADELAASVQKVNEISQERDALQTKFDAMQAEYTTLKAQEEEYRKRVGGAKTGGDASANSEGETRIEEIERLKAQYKYSMEGI